MTDSDRIEDIEIINTNALKTLARSIKLAKKDFQLILVCCNHSCLRSKILKQWQEIYIEELSSSFIIKQLFLSNKITTLYTTIKETIGNEQPQALMIFGLEEVIAIEQVLKSANNARNEFRKNFNFPIVLWINNDIHRQLIRLARDFEDWTTRIDVQISNEELLNFIHYSVSNILFPNLDLLQLNKGYCREIELALQELENRNLSIDEKSQSILRNFLEEEKFTIQENQQSLNTLIRGINFSDEQFSLILVHCNYTILSNQILQNLLNLSLVVQKITLPKSIKIEKFDSTIQMALENLQLSALMIEGLDCIEELDIFLSSANYVRERFIRSFPFPVLLSVNDQVMQKLIRLAPDFVSWATTEFTLPNQVLLQFLEQETDALFAKVLTNEYKESRQAKINKDDSVLEQAWEHSHELYSAINEVRERGITLEPQLNASLQFVFGLDDYVSDASGNLTERIHQALEHFQTSLLIWQNLVAQTSTANQIEGKQTSLSSPLIRQSVLLFYIGLCHCRLAEQNQLNNRYWEAAKSCLQQSLESLQLAQRPDIAAKFIGQLAEVLEHLQEWDKLQIVAQHSLELHQIYGSQIQLAYDYGFLAQVASQGSRWLQASILAHVALLKLDEAQRPDDQAHENLFPLLLAQFYYLVLAKAQQNLGENAVAQTYLDKAAQELNVALENSVHQYDVHRYIRMLRKLRSLYFEAGRYLEAYCIRQKLRSVEQQYGFRAFIGAGRLQPQRQATNPALMSASGSSSIALEIEASGRERDINNLIGRISRADQKLIVIHGPSGVGKSSTVNAGLVPALQNRIIGDQIAVPVVLQVYTDWVRELGESLEVAISDLRSEIAVPEAFTETSITISSILEQLHQNANNHLITVLIFDQFEEFFFSFTDRQQKQKFDQFVSNCLDISRTKVIFSLREDYLHHLLELKQVANLEAINNNILDKQIRYQLNNFSPEYAKAIIQKLTARSLSNLEPALIDALVADLSTDLGEIRPIELQLVGAQLQDEGITTLSQYQPYRPNRLIERYMKGLIKDCGPENERAALLVLYLLTDESNQRPFKTRAELAAELSELEDTDKLELVLNILVSSGLVVLFPDVPERYQLIHDYLVDLIRYLQEQESSLQAQLNQLRQKVEQSQTEIERLQRELRQKKQHNKLIYPQPQQGLDLLTELRELRKREELSQLEIEQLRAELKEKELTAQLAESQKQQRIREARLNRLLKIALTVALVAILGLATSLWLRDYSSPKTNPRNCNRVLC